MNTTRIICYACSPEEISRIKAEASKFDAEVLETDVYQDVSAIPCIMAVINPTIADIEGLEYIGSLLRECPILVNLVSLGRCPQLDIQKAKYTVADLDELLEKMKFLLLSYRRSAKSSEDFSKKITNALIVLKLIKLHPSIKTKEIAKHLEMNERTALRIINSLSCANELIAYDEKKKGWYLMGGYSVLLEDANSYIERTKLK